LLTLSDPYSVMVGQLSDRLDLCPVCMYTDDGDTIFTLIRTTPV